MTRGYWLFKSDPETFGWEHLLRSPGRTTPWDGVRNYQARNFLRDQVQLGDGVLFYHSGAEKAVVGTAIVVRPGYPEPDDPLWSAVDIRAESAFAEPVPLDAMRRTPGLEGMALLRRGSRLSVTPVAAGEWSAVCRLGRPSVL